MYPSLGRKSGEFILYVVTQSSYVTSLTRPQTQWELATADIPPPQYIFPEDDLIAHLTQIYFEELNIYMPILHRPTFEKAVADGLHHRDHYFGAVVLTLCAVAARNSDDPRTIMEGTNSKHSSGWQWFSQVQILRRSLMRTASLHELQYYCVSVHIFTSSDWKVAAEPATAPQLAAYYVQGSSTPQAVWTVVGLGLRFAQEKGIHRRKLSNHQWTVEDELYKRAFWYVMHRLAVSLSDFPQGPARHRQDDMFIPWATVFCARRRVCPILVILSCTNI